MTIETRHWTADVLTESSGHEPYSTIVADPTAARKRVDEDTTDGFVRETDFEQSYVLVVRYTMQSARWLELGRIERTKSGIRASVETRSPEEPYGDDAAPHSLAIRVTDERRDIPEEVLVEVDRESVTFAPNDR